MYHEIINQKVKNIISELQDKCMNLIENSVITDSLFNQITNMVNNELGVRADAILTDLLYDLQDRTLKAPFFENISIRNKFRSLNLIEITSENFKFTVNNFVYNNEASITYPFFIGIGSFLGSGLILAFFKGFKLSTFFPIPIVILVLASSILASIDYYINNGKRGKRGIKYALNQYFTIIEKDLVKWFEEAEDYYNNRVNEFKLTI